LLSPASGHPGSTKEPLEIAVKWADNVQKPGDIMDFYLSGDVAPLGRFAWRLWE
jgi:hypothetical protein